MKRINFIISFILLIVMYTSTQAQNMQKHRWKNRLILIETNDIQSDVFKQQLSILKEEKSELAERKLMIYQFSENRYRKGLTESSHWQKSNQPVLVEKPFTVKLIGLDGGVKLIRNQPVSTRELFDLIDSMPMRQAEMRRNHRK